MKGVLANRNFRRLFGSQVMSLLGTGLMTVALALLAYDIGGTAQAGMVLAGAFTVKMIAYVGFAPVANLLVEKVPVRPLLVGLDAMRLVLALLLPLTGAVWQIYLLMLLFQMCSAAFTPAYQSTIPDILDDEAQYTAALSLSRVAYNLETMLSPALAGILLLVVAPPSLFLGTALAFAVSAGLLFSANLPARPVASGHDPFLRRLGKGYNIYLRTIRLRGLLAINFAMSLTLAWVLVNTVAYVGLRFEGDASAYTNLMAAYGAGSIASAFAVPRLLRHMSERRLMISGTFAMGCLPFTILAEPGFVALMGLWATLGAATSLVLTPGALLLVRSSSKANRPALFAAQFSLSHAAWLVAYPLSGWLGTALGLETAFMVLASMTLAIAAITAHFWPAHDSIEREHTHIGLAPTHPHLEAWGYKTIEGRSGMAHSHPFHIDELHRRWPTEAGHV
ncbi:MAG: MFS transporter [Albidovulum sp.]